MDKISASEYVSDKTLLKLNYIPHNTKVSIINTIMAQTLKSDSVVDWVLLDRVSTQIFIETITNLDLSVTDDQGLDGYDTLMFHGVMNNVIESCGTEYQIFRDILKAKVDAYEKANYSTSTAILMVAQRAEAKIDAILSSLIDKVEGLNVDNVASKLETLAEAQEKIEEAEKKENE